MLTVATSLILFMGVFTVLTVCKRSILLEHRSLLTSPCMTLSLHTLNVAFNVKFHDLQID